VRTRLRHAIMLAFCALLGMPLGAAALVLNGDYEKSTLTRQLDSSLPDLFAKPDLILEGQGRLGRFTRIPELGSAFPVEGIERPSVADLPSEFSEQFPASRTLRRFGFFRRGSNADTDALRDRILRRRTHNRARMAWVSRTTYSPPPASVPEPTTAILLGIGLVGLSVAGRRNDA